LIFIPLTLSVVPAKANTILAAGTPGEPGTDVDARSLAMGGAALGLFDGSNVNALNPAVPASYNRAVFAVTLVRGYNSYETAQGRSVEITYDVPRAELAMPVSPSLALSFAFRQELNQNYEYTRPIEDEEGSIIGTNRVRGIGSVYSLSAGVARRFDDRWFGGVAAGYDFGAPEVIDSKEYKVKGYSWGEEISETVYKGIKAGIGAGYSASAKLSFGAAAHVYGNHRVHETVSNGYATIYERDRRFAMPYSFGVGAAYVPGPRGRFAADARYTRWSRFAVDGEDFGCRDTFELHAGAEGRLTTARKSFFLWRMPYRAGVSYVPWYSTESGRFAKVGVSLGAGYLFMNNEDSRLDFTLVYGRRGDLASRGLEEEMFDFYLSIVGLETWLGKHERED
jgi:long-subunit fatty acid transport protein